MRLPSDKTIGILGGGQLGKMLIEASRPWNIKNVVLENDALCPASDVASNVIVGSLYDEDKIRELAAVSDVLTWEIEHVNVDALLRLESEGMKIIPSPLILKIIQDKGIQKDFYTTHKIATSDYLLVDSNEKLMECLHQFPGAKVVLKARTGGYDGKGVSIMSKADILAGNYVFSGPLLVEEFKPNVLECAIIVARDEAGNTAVFPSIEMFFHPVSNLVEFLFSPARFSEIITEKCRDLAVKAITALNGTGLFAVELFITENEEVLVNEIAPRPHNSGHHTIEGCYTSQFEQLNRILLGYPLGKTGIVKPCAMVNLVGPKDLTGEYILKNAEALLQMEGVYVHLYNKKTIKPDRKMGHITILADTLEKLFEKAEEVKKLAGFC